jgi:LPXTG-motif cell wall-anchored protein
MKRLVFLGIVYVLVAAAILPGSLLAQDEGTPPAEQAAPAPTTTVPEPSATVPAPVPAPTTTAPATTLPTPAPAPAPAAPEVQKLEDEKPAPAPRAVASASTAVTIKDFDFTPASVTINVGDTVTWTNNGPTGHSATSTGGEFDTGIMDAGNSGSHTFDTAGTFSYICTPHPYMKGTVVVQGASTGGSGDDDAAATGDTGSGTGADTDDGPSLPSTGMDALALGLAGLLMMGLGVGVRRRTAAEGAQPAGRIGW